MKSHLSFTILWVAFQLVGAQGSNIISNGAGLGFIENKGQILDQGGKLQDEVLYFLPTRNNNVILRADGFSYDTYVMEGDTDGKNEISNRTKLKNVNGYKYKYHRVDVSFRNSSSISIETGDKAEDYLVYYIGGDEKLTFHYNRILYRNVYPGIDVEFLASQDDEKEFEYNFIVHPGADVSSIQLAYSGAYAGNLSDGNVNLLIAHGQLTETIPESYLIESRRSVDIKYRLISAAQDEVIVGFSGILKHLNKEALVIDPTPHRSWGSYYGGSSSDYGMAIATDGSGNIYIAGFTGSSGSIATSGAHQVTISGGYDAFVAKFNSAGVRQWSTYYGGTSDDFASSVSIDGSGNIYLVGETRSSSSISTSGAHQTTYGGGLNDAFLLKLNSSGIRQWATYYGGSGTDWAEGVKIDGAGNAYVVGITTSTGSIATSGAHQVTYGGGTQDAFLVKFNGNGVRQWGTYYGGSSSDYGKGIAINGSNAIYISGGSFSSSGIATTGAHQTIHSGNGDAFLTKFNGNGVRQWGTYYGGSQADYAEDVAADVSGNIYVAGGTTSTSSIVTSGAHQISYGGGTMDCFLVKFNTNGTRQWGTYYGGTQSDYAWSVSTDGSSNVYLVGNTQSVGGIATSGAHKTSYGGGVDAFLAKFNSTGVQHWGSYYGGSGQESGEGIVTYGEANVYIVGFTTSTSSIATINGHQTSYGGGAYDAYVTKFICDPDGIGTITVIGDFCQSGYVQLTAGSGSSYLWSTGATSQSITVYAAGTYSVNYTFSGCNKSAQAYVDDNCCPDPYNPLCPCPPGENCARVRSPYSEDEQTQGEEASPVGLFPNPANTEFTIVLSMPTQMDTKVELSDLGGKVRLFEIIKRGEIRRTINTESVSTGVYVVRYFDGGSLITKKLIITDQ